MALINGIQWYRTLLAISSVLFFNLSLQAQSDTIKKLHDQYDDAFVLFFYHNTLQMLNPNNDEQLDALIRDIDKMKFLSIDKSENTITQDDIQTLYNNYKEENFEELLNLREKNTQVKALIKEKGGITYGLSIIMNSEDSLNVFDIKGSLPIEKIMDFIQFMMNSGKLN